MVAQQPVVLVGDDVFELYELRTVILHIRNVVEAYRQEGDSLVSTINRAIQEEYQKGYNEGYDDSYDVGYSEGYDNGYDYGFSVGSENND